MGGGPSRLRVRLGTLVRLAFFAEPARRKRSRRKCGGVEPLDFVTASGTHIFLVEVMRTDAQREKGLMFRRYLAAGPRHVLRLQHRGAGHDVDEEHLFPLDMVFMNRRECHVDRRGYEPLSERIVPSGGPVYAVLNQCRDSGQIDLKLGDQVQNALFRT